MIWSHETAVLQADGKALEYRCWGPPPDRAPTIVMLHEGLGSLSLWRDFPALVQQTTGCGVMAYSRAGYGQSDLADLPRPVDYMTHEAVTVLPQVLDAVGIRKGILLGHSDGATIAAIYAGSVADHRIRGLILMAPHFFTEPMGLAQIAQATELRERMARHHRDPDHTFRGWHDAWMSGAFRDWNVAEVIDYLRVPVLALQGREDQYGTLAQIDEITERSYAPVDVEILEACRHEPQRDQPEKTLAAITEFAARLQRIEAAEVATR